MRYRLVIILSIFALFGSYAQQASASGCSARRGCMPPMRSGHVEGAKNHACSCLPGNFQLSRHSCGQLPLLREFPQLILRSGATWQEHNAAAQSVPLQENTDINPVASAHGHHVHSPPASCPIYLQTLALLI